MAAGRTAQPMEGALASVELEAASELEKKDWRVRERQLPAVLENSHLKERSRSLRRASEEEFD